MSLRRTVAPVLVAAVSLALIGALSSKPAPPPRGEEGLLLPRPALLHAVFAAQQNLIADFYWLRVLNLIGRASADVDHKDIYLMSNLVTDLDPKFEQVYRFGGVMIPKQMSGGKYILTEESTALLKKGVTHLPAVYSLKFQLAYNLMFFHGQQKEAAEILFELSRWPNTPPWLPQLATRLLAASGDLEGAMTVTQQLHDNAIDPELRDIYEKRLREIALERVLRLIDSAAVEYREKEGVAPRQLKDLFEKGYLYSLPPDPMGGQYYLGQDGRGHSSAVKHRLELIQLEM